MGAEYTLMCEGSTMRVYFRWLTSPKIRTIICLSKKLRFFGHCFRVFSQFSSWTSWGSCTAPPGRCSVNSGTKRRTRSITRNPSCGGSSCPHTTETSSCTPVPIRCQVLYLYLFLPNKLRFHHHRPHYHHCQSQV